MQFEQQIATEVPSSAKQQGDMDRQQTKLNSFEKCNGNSDHQSHHLLADKSNRAGVDIRLTTHDIGSCNTSTDEERSKIADFYDNRSVFITGASGFIGKILIEKLIRTCPRLRNVFVLIRPKWKKTPKERLDELLDAPLFDNIRETHDLSNRIILVEGDVCQPNFGMSKANLLRIMNEVSVIFHSAATVKFDDPLKQSIGINITGAKHMIDICRKIPQLAAVVHVSTAYANCNQSSIDEHIYPVDIDPERLIEMADWLSQDALQELKKHLLGTRPNTYTYTKALGEWLVYKCARDLPIVICRPSIVVATWKEPFEGWIDNVNGPTGVVLGAGKGLIRSMLCESKNVADLVPADTVINLIVSLGWFANVYYNHRRQHDTLDSLLESPYSGQSLASSLIDENNHNYVADRVQYIAEARDGIENANHYHQRVVRSQKPTDEIDVGKDVDYNDVIGKDGFGQTIDDKFSKNSPRLTINNNSSIYHEDFFPRQASATMQQNHLNVNQLNNSDYGSNKSDTNSLHSTSRSSPSEPQFEQDMMGPGARAKQAFVNCGDNNELSASKDASYSTQLQLEDQNRSDFEYKLKQFRHDTRARLLAKNLPEDLADVPVFHCTSGKDNPITWGYLQVAILSMWALYPSISTYRFPMGAFTNNRRVDNFWRATQHYLPAYILDFVTRIGRGKPILVKIFRKFDQAASVLETFTMGQWTFANDNRLTLINDLMGKKDKELFDCDLKSLDWQEFCKGYVLGSRRFLLKEPIENLEVARRNLSYVYYRNLSLQVLFIAMGIYFLVSWIF